MRVTRLSMQVSRRGDHYHGSLTRTGDQVCLPFSGLLELIAVLERLTTSEPEPDPGGGASDPEVPDA